MNRSESHLARNLVLARDGIPGRLDERARAIHVSVLVLHQRRLEKRHGREETGGHRRRRRRGTARRRLRRTGRRAGGTIIRRVRRESERVKPEHVASERRASTGEQALVHERGAREAHHDNEGAAAGD